MKKYDILKKVEGQLIAIVRASSAEAALAGAEALIEGGITVLEVTLTTPGATRVIEALCAKYGDRVTIGAGSVLDAESAAVAMYSGAKFMVTPTLDRDTLLFCNRYSIPVFPGISTATEAKDALTYGADAVKLFPAGDHKYSYIKDIKAPLPNLEVVPTGGVSADNILEWKKAGAFAYGVGGSLTAGLKTGDYASMTAEARKMLAILNG